MTTASGLLLAAGFVTHVAGVGWRAAIGGEEVPTPLAAHLFYVGAVVTGGWFVAPKAWRSLIRLRPDMNLLMTIAVAGALGIREVFEAATVAFLFALSLALESWSVGRARHAIADGATAEELEQGPADSELLALRDAERVLFSEQLPGAMNGWSFEMPETVDDGHTLGLPYATPPAVTAPALAEDDVEWLKSLTLPDLPIVLDRRVVTYLKFYRDSDQGRAIAAIWTSLRHVFFPSEMDRTCSSGSGSRTEFYVINEIGICHFIRKKKAKPISLAKSWFCKITNWN